jgi:serine/threonine protein kinase
LRTNTNHLPPAIYILHFVPTIAEYIKDVNHVESIVSALLSSQTAKGGKLRGGTLKNIGQGGFGTAYSIDNEDDFNSLFEFYKKRYLRTDRDKCRMEIVRHNDNAEYTYSNLVLKEFKEKRLADLEITNIGIVKQCIKDTYNGNKCKSVFNNLNYHQGLECTPENIIEKYTPIHPLIKEIKFFSPNGVNDRTLVPSVKREGDLYKKTKSLKNKISVDEIDKVYRSCLILLYALHSQGYYHFDIKPENIFYQAPDIYNLADYGLVGRVYGGQGSITYLSPLKYKGVTEWNNPLKSKNNKLV